MKALGPIPAGFAAIDGELAIAGHKASALVASAGATPLFVYDADLVSARIAALRVAMPARLGLHYALKANPFAPLLRHIAALVDGFDIASGGEQVLALAAGVEPARISFTGPGKRDAEITAAIRAGVTLNLESAREAEHALAIADSLGTAPRLAIRVNPDFDIKGSGMKMGGGAKPFGIDAEHVPALIKRLVSAGCDWQGLHIYAGSQALDSAAISEVQAQTLLLAARLAESADMALPRCNLGGGFGIPYFPGDTPIELHLIGEALEQRFAELPVVLAQTRFCIELGRYLVGEAGVYLARIVERKESHGEVFLVTDGGLHHQLAASGNFGTVVRRNYPSAIATRYGAPPAEEASIVGCLCTPLDRLADKGGFPRAEEGDLVAVFCAGAYGASASPAQFLGHGPAAEILVCAGVRAGG
ncbi:pyridoxal-dependent decarboxylase, exosortase A system-associated [Novosphingobium sp. Chol11]|uniref:pyridoxal-dependent decarboxylase, exosortase A system-associated n=1 Tax=Novosphingobium sp. Chol11 TaxID=1385763 RepID=UPI0025DD8CD8|nr:pyridoxal-dependent decarboxylase, exosortase A system-associated [Novosphingobium sp. Chol11]